MPQGRHAQRAHRASAAERETWDEDEPGDQEFC